MVKTGTTIPGGGEEEVTFLFLFDFFSMFIKGTGSTDWLSVHEVGGGGADFFLVPLGPGMEVSLTPFCHGNFSLAMLCSNI